MTQLTVSFAMSLQKLMTLWQRLSLRTINRSWAHGSAESVKQSMDKQDLIHFLYLAVAVLAAWGGYIMGVASGNPA
jgi:hypothetical protein